MSAVLAQTDILPWVSYHPQRIIEVHKLIGTVLIPSMCSLVRCVSGCPLRVPALPCFKISSWSAEGSRKHLRGRGQGFPLPDQADCQSLAMGLPGKE